MDSLNALLVVAAVVLIGLPLALHLWHLRSLRRLPRELAALKQRIATLESSRPFVWEAPPPLPVEMPLPAPPAIAPPRQPRAAVSLENVIGVKLFAWLGGLALFVGVLLAVRYAFENNLITPGLRVAASGALIGLALIGGGLLAAARRFHTPAFSMCATGILVLYGDIYAAHAYYDLLPLAAAIVLMTAVSAGAFLLALRLDAQVIVVLGMLGGFLTPALLWSTSREPLPLFSYAALLNAGVAAVAIRKRWNALILLAALGTVATEFVWLAEFFDAWNARIIFLCFGGQFLAISLLRQRLRPAERWSAVAATLALYAGVFGAFSFSDANDAHIHSAAFILPFIFFCNVGLVVLSITRARGENTTTKEWNLAAAAPALTWALEWTWHNEHFTSAAAFTPLLWYLAVFALFAAHPYFAGATARLPWTIAAGAGALQFWLVYRVCIAAYPLAATGLLPLAFALPFATGAWFLVRWRDVPVHSPDSRLASQAGAALVFLSLVFPVQFRAEWITVGWALEGIALLLLYRVLPNARLPLVAIVVLCGAFARLAFNPAVLEYHPRTAVPLWNWYLYAYGITAVCLLVSARLLHGQPVRGRYASRLLYTLGAVTAFLLLNLEIADYFSPGKTLTFSFTGNFARDMTYSISWALFAFALLLIGMRSRSEPVRYAAIALLLVTLAKLFLHDFAILGPLYRIGAFVGVAAVLIVASFVYQRFLSPAAENSGAAR